VSPSGSDGIALSQIKTLTGLGKNTVIRALRNLIRQKVIKRYTEFSPHRYSIIVSNQNNKSSPNNHNPIENRDSKPSNKNCYDNSNHAFSSTDLYSDSTLQPSCCEAVLRGSESEPVEVQKNNHQPVQNLNPQKKPFKQTERNTIGSSDWSVEIILIAEYWKEVFSKEIDLSDVPMVDQIENCLNHFSVDDIKKAIFNRSRTTYYREKKPFLLDKPSAFFPWPETVANDLKREPEGIYTYDQKNDRIFQGLNTDADFEIMRELRDEQDRPKWQLKTGN